MNTLHSMLALVSRANIYYDLINSKMNNIVSHKVEIAREMYSHLFLGNIWCVCIFAIFRPT
jgi:hypothetical protein